MVDNKLIIGGSAALVIILSTLLLTTNNTRCLTEPYWEKTDQLNIYYCADRDIYRACEELSSTKKTCYHIKEEPPIIDNPPLTTKYGIINDCSKIITLERYHPETISKFIKCYPENGTDCVEHYEYTEIRVAEPYTTNICEEIGVEINGKKIYYKSDGKSCLRTENILCCWLDNDGGTYIDSRKGDFRTKIRSGESGKCINLESLEITSQRNDYKTQVLVEFT